MKVIWSPKAKKTLRSVTKYIIRSFGITAAEKFKESVIKAEKLLCNTPLIGPTEPLLANHSRLYRSLLVNNLNKVVYYVEDDIVHIASFWDVRREPKELVEDLEEE